MENEHPSPDELRKQMEAIQQTRFCGPPDELRVPYFGPPDDIFDDDWEYEHSECPNCGKEFYNPKTGRCSACHDHYYG